MHIVTATAAALALAGQAAPAATAHQPTTDGFWRMDREYRSAYGRPPGQDAARLRSRPTQAPARR